MNRRQIIIAVAGALGLPALARLTFREAPPMTAESQGTYEVNLTEAEWRARLTPRQFAILRQHDTEFAGTSPLLGEHRDGTFACAGCGQPLFESEAKYESGTGWPSFWKAIDGAVGTTVDRQLGMVRTEIHCSRCGGHIGHVFPDGPRPTGLRYCTNGAALNFTPAE
jgi:peptide-methionine (R)-S-oxide reductase